MSMMSSLKIVARFDFTSTFQTLDKANNFINRTSNNWGDYNTAIKVGNEWAVTNKYDPRCNDKTSPVTPGYECHG
jgi:hypothetical protein